MPSIDRILCPTDSNRLSFAGARSASELALEGGNP